MPLAPAVTSSKKNFTSLMQVNRAVATSIIAGERWMMGRSFFCSVCLDEALSGDLVSPHGIACE